MLRRVFNVFVGSSLILCLAIAGLWVRSWWRADSISYYSGMNSDLFEIGGSVMSEGGSMGYQHVHARHLAAFDAKPYGSGWGCRSRPNEHYMLRAMQKEGHEWHGFGYAIDPITPEIYAQARRREMNVTVMAPHWAVVAVTGVMPGVWAVIRWRRGRRREAGCCAGYGFDLRATPQRCPECGREVAADSSQLKVARAAIGESAG